jgi:hypothetical protein
MTATVLDRSHGIDEEATFAMVGSSDETRLQLQGSSTLTTTRTAPPPATFSGPEEKAHSGFSSLSARPMYFVDPRQLEPTSSTTLFFSPRKSTADATGSLRLSLDALSKAAAETDSGVWLDAAATLKRDAVRLRNSSAYGRHAAVLLTLADGLTFTRPSDPTLEASATEALHRGLSVLTDPFISTDAEKDLMKDLLSRGWNIAPASEGLAPPA